MIVPIPFSNLRLGPERQRGISDSIAPTVPPEGHAESENPTVDPTDLRYVGPATADVIDNASFDAGDLRNRTVSYAELLEAGVNSGVAGKLRREYSLVWSFEWIAGANLRHRARSVGGLDTEQRKWIASSSSADGSRSNLISDAERAWRERSHWVNGTDPPTCKRCGDDLVTLRLGESQTIQCEACGFVGVSVRF